tara:strand:- start:503 stop:1213 length:711 start_codon:yes stop_codon:yes gene_type:complete
MTLFAIRSRMGSLGARLGSLRAAARMPLQPPAAPKRMQSTLAEAAEAVEGQYALSLRWLHWVMGASMLTCMGTVKASQWTTGETFLGTKGQTKGTLMMIHKSTAVLVSAMLFPRVLLRVATKAPPPIPGNILEKFAANVSHVAMYGFMAFMPFTGLAMGYYGGKGVPFYGLYTFPGATGEAKDGKFAGRMFKLHKQVGQYIYYLVPVHVGAAFFHVFRGQAILTRVNPLVTVASKA